MKKYLTEQLLGDFLKKLYGDKNVIAQVPVDGTKMKIDYQVTIHNGDTIYVEFDGDSHYCKPDVIYRDQIKNEKFGNSLIRIPYFIQLDEFTIHHYFKVYVWDHPQLIQYIDYDYYPHGFIADKVTFPSQFCSRGIDRFFAELKAFDKYDYGDALGRTMKVSNKIRFSLIDHPSKFPKRAYPENKLVDNDPNTLQYAYDLIPGAFPMILDKFPTKDKMVEIENIAKEQCKVLVVAPKDDEQKARTLAGISSLIYRMTINSHLDDLHENVKNLVPNGMDEDYVVDIVYKLRMV